MRLPEEPDLPPRIDMVAAIDVIFAILAFFILVALNLTPSQGIPVSLPKAETTESRPPPEITISIDAAENLTVNLQPVQLNELEASVRSLIENDPSVLIAINADANASHGRVIAVMDRLRSIEGARFGFRTQASQPNSAP